MKNCLLAYFILTFNIATTWAQDQNDDDILLQVAPIIAAAIVDQLCDRIELTATRDGCEFTLDRDVNLNGRTLRLPARARLLFNGGQLRNGTLIFNGVIDGRLLNPSLSILGSARLASTRFAFDPNVWRIQQTDSANPRPPAQAVAFANKRILQSTINLVRRMGADTFVIGRMDAYFDPNEQVAGVIDMPSNFHLSMSSQTTLRAFPVSEVFSAKLININGQTNIRVTGGRLIGDRLEHGPVDGGTELFVIKGGQNIVVDGVDISLSSATGLTINSIFFEGDSNFFQSQNIVVRNCRFDSNRNNNLSITDGQNIVVEDSVMLRAGVDLPARFGVSAGRAPRIGIVMEPFLGQVIRDVTIRNNVVRSMRPLTNSILAADGDRYTLTGNTTDGNIGWTLASEVTVSDNIIDGGGVTGGFNDGFALAGSRDNVISGNTIRNASIGLELTNDDIEAFNNRIEDTSIAIFTRSLSDSNIFDNTIVSSEPNSFGVIAQNFANNVSIRNNTFNLNGRVLSIGGINNEPGQSAFKLSIENNRIQGTNVSRITSSSNVEVRSNQFINGGFLLGNAFNMVFDSNRLTTRVGSSVVVEKNRSTQNIQIKNNTISNSQDRGHGVLIQAVGGGDLQDENTQVLIDGNSIAVNGGSSGVLSTGFDGVTINNNSVRNNAHPGFDFETIILNGNDSTITNNRVTHGVLVTGQGNSVSDNVPIQ